MKLIRSRKEIGSGGAGIAACMLGFSVVYFVFYFIVNWIYDTKEERKFGNHLLRQEELRMVSKEEVMKRGIGQHVFKCYGFLGNACTDYELYKATVQSDDGVKKSSSKHAK